MSDRRDLLVRLVLLEVGAAASTELLGYDSLAVSLAGGWLAGNLFWLESQVGTLLGIRSGRGRWAAMLRLLFLGSGLWAMMAWDLVPPMEMLIAATWFYPGLAVSYLVRPKTRI